MYTRNGHDFLVLLQDDDLKNFRAFVRSARLKPCGHWAMGAVTFHNRKISISGDYGSDGLPITVRSEAWWKESEYQKEQRENLNFAYKRSVPLPDWLEYEWNISGGHNSAGSEAESFRIWANLNKTALRFGNKGTFRVRYVLGIDETTQEEIWTKSGRIFHHRKDAERYIKPMPESRKAEIIEV